MSTLRPIWWLWLGALLAACEPLPDNPCLNVCNDTDGNDTDFVFDETLLDKDCDGFTEDVDCNDDNCFIYPGAPREYNNGVDDDCDGVADVFYGCGEEGTAGGPLGVGLVLALGWLARRRRTNGGGDPGPGSAMLPTRRAP